MSCSGFITGGATPATATIDPDSGTASAHDSRNEWSGRIRSARTLVSSRKLPKLTMNGIFASVSRTLHAGGVVKTGFAPSISSTSRVADDAPAERRRAAEQVGSLEASRNPAARGRAISELRREEHAAGCSTLPTSALSALTASALKRPLVCASGGPPMIATDGPPLGELAREPLDAARRHAGELLDLLGRVVGEARTPALDRRPRATRRSPAAACRA